MNADDCGFLLDILNYNMRPVFQNLGFNVDGGEFVYASHDKINPSQQIDIVQKLSSMGLPIDDDYLYETFSVRKPDNYDELKLQKEAERQAMRDALAADKGDKKNTSQTPVNNRLRSFFGLAPKTGAR